jgi:hypothetical protein
LQPRQGATTGLLAAFFKTTRPGPTKFSYSITPQTANVNVYQTEVWARLEK